MKKLALISVTHDPLGKNFELIKKFAKDIRNLYSEAFITISNETDSEVIKELENNLFNVKIIQKLGAANARREVLKFGLASSSDYYHYCDFDRLLTWISQYPKELESLVNEICNYDYLIIGRTERAFDSHPVEWKETEKISNRITSIELGFNVDVTAGSCGFSRKSAMLISEHSKDKMTDAEWPMIIKRIGNLPINYKASDGLEYKEDINNSQKDVSDAEKWLVRLKLSYIISESAVKTGKDD